MKNNIYACREIQLRVATVYLLVIRQLKSLKFKDKDNYFQKHATDFIRLIIHYRKEKN